MFLFRFSCFCIALFLLLEDLSIYGVFGPACIEFVPGLYISLEQVTGAWRSNVFFSCNYEWCPARTIMGLLMSVKSATKWY